MASELEKLQTNAYQSLFCAPDKRKLYDTFLEIKDPKDPLAQFFTWMFTIPPDMEVHDRDLVLSLQKFKMNAGGPVLSQLYREIDAAFKRAFENYELNKEKIKLAATLLRPRFLDDSCYYPIYNYGNLEYILTLLPPEPPRVLVGGLGLGGTGSFPGEKFLEPPVQIMSVVEPPKLKSISFPDMNKYRTSIAGIANEDDFNLLFRGKPGVYVQIRCSRCTHSWTMYIDHRGKDQIRPQESFSDSLFCPNCSAEYVFRLIKYSLIVYRAKVEAICIYQNGSIDKHVYEAHRDSFVEVGATDESKAGVALHRVSDYQDMYLTVLETDPI